MGRHSFVFMRHVSLLNGIAFQVSQTAPQVPRRHLLAVPHQQNLPLHACDKHNMPL